MCKESAVLGHYGVVINPLSVDHMEHFDGSGFGATVVVNGVLYLGYADLSDDKGATLAGKVSTVEGCVLEGYTGTSGLGDGVHFGVDSTDAVVGF